MVSGKRVPAASSERSSVIEEILTPRSSVLIADPDPEIRRRLNLCLTHAGYRVLCAASESEALTICRHFTGPLILLIREADGSGTLDSSLAVSAIEVRPNLPVLFIPSSFLSICEDPTEYPSWKSSAMKEYSVLEIVDTFEKRSRK